MWVFRCKFWLIFRAQNSIGTNNITQVTLALPKRVLSSGGGQD